MIFIGNTKLNSEQQQAVNHFKGPMMVIAGPGSGKTRVLTERIKKLIEEHNVPPNEILVITFSKKASIEMRQRFCNLIHDASTTVYFGTFHACFYHILSNHYNLTKENIITPKEKHRYIGEIGIANTIEDSGNISWQKEILEHIACYKVVGEEYWNSYFKDISNDCSIDIIKKICDEYIRRCKREHKIDFDDMIILCRDLLKSNIEIRKKWQNYFKFILVDEFQDINELQYETLMLLGSEHGNIFCVGDDDQSIYAFRGAKPSLMKKFILDMQDCKVINLYMNYRCKANIVGAANTLITHNVERISRPCQQVIADTNKGGVEIVEASSTVLSAEYVCNKILELKNVYSYNYSDFAIIYRSAHCAKMVEDICKVRGIPICDSNAKFDLFETKVGQVILAYIKIALGVGTRGDWIHIINNPNRGISRECLTGKVNYEEAILNFYKNNYMMQEIINSLIYDLKYIRKLSPYAALIYILKNLKMGDNSTIINQEILDQLKDVMHGFDTLEGLVQFACGEIKLDKEQLSSENDKIQLLTAHASKGLEYEVVFVVGLQEGLFPHNKNLHGIAVEEERRLMYVAMTRAKQHLVLCSLHMDEGKQRSRFINEIMENQSFINSNSSLSRNSSNASATASYSSSSSI